MKSNGISITMKEKPWVWPPCCPAPFGKL